MKILQIAGFGKKFGSGHLTRQNIIKEILNNIGINSDILTIEEKKDIFKVDLSSYDIFFNDFRDSNEKIDRFFGSKKLICFDDHYLPKIYRGYRFYWNSIPSLDNYGNITSLSYLILNDFNEKEKINEKEDKEEKEKIEKIENNAKKLSQYDIIVNFGNLDPSNLSIKVANFLIKNKDNPEIKNIVDFKSMLFILPKNIYSNIKNNKNKSVFSDFEILDAGNEKYKYYVLNSKIVITHFGLFLFESIKLKKKCIIVSPTKYHEKLANKYFNNYHITKYKKINSKKFISLLSNLVNQNNININEVESSKFSNDNIKNEKNNKFLSNQFEISNKNLISNLIDELLKFNKENFEKKDIICPVCKNTKTKIIGMAEKYHLLICQNCKTIIKESINYEKMNEDLKESYYIDEYLNTYGKTYFEDRENIKKLNQKRLKNILPILINLNNNKIKAIDFGGALGFFLDDLKEELNLNNKDIEGYIIENNSYALDFCNKKGYNSYNSIDKLEENLKNSFNLISFWFCIEHIKDFDKIIKKAHDLLCPYGILSLSFPSQFGPMFYFKKNRDIYFKTRPEDHFYDFNPYSFRRFLEKNGFKVYKISIPNIHFERFKNASTFLSKIIGKKIYEKISKLIFFGDICEIYAYKK